MSKRKPDLWPVAGLMLLLPCGVWRLACKHANKGRWSHVQFRPSTAQAGYRSDSLLRSTADGKAHVTKAAELLAGAT